MPRDHMRDDRRERWEAARDRRPATPRDDFGQADFSNDYSYDPDRRAGYRAADESTLGRDDYGQADYSKDYAFDPDSGQGYRRYAAENRDYDAGLPPDRSYGRRMDEGDYPRPAADRSRIEPDYGERSPGERGRSWVDRAGAFFGGREEGGAVRRRRGPSDRVLWAVIVERLEDERGLDLRDVEVLVEDAEVTLNGTVRRKDDKRRIEDIADLDGVRHVQNNLRLRDGGRRWF